MTTGHQLVTTSGEKAITRPPDDFGKALTVDPQYVERTKASLAILRTMVNDILVAGRDYGAVVGIPDEFLWEPGADLIIASFNCHPGPARVLNQLFTDDKIAVTIEEPIISYQTDKEVTCGIGAASTCEVKHKYRWLWENELPDWGYSPETAKQLKTRKAGKSKDKTQYRIPNPEPGELLNVIWKIARKRAKSAAAQSLPGVSSALREKLGKKKDEQGDKKISNQWDSFWADLNKSGVDSKMAHEIMNVEHISDLLRQGWTLDKVKDHILHNIPGKETAPRQGPTTEELGQVRDKIDESLKRREIVSDDLAGKAFEDLESAGAPSAAPAAKPEPAKTKLKFEWGTVTKADVPDLIELERLFCRLTGQSTRAMYTALKVNSRQEVTDTAWEAFLKLKDRFQPQK